jgi:O-antigen ligase
MAKKGRNTSPNNKSFLEKAIAWGIILVFAVLPILYFPGRAASYVTSKQYFLIGIVDVLVVLWTWLLLTDKRYRLSKTNLLYLAPVFLFLLSLTVSAFAGVDPATSFFSIVESGTGLIVLYHILAFACMIASVIRVQGKRFFTYILQANLLASVILAGFTFFTGSNGVFQTSSTMLDGSSGGAMMGNSLLAGAYFIFSIFLTIYLIVHESTTWRKVLYWLGLALIIVSPIFLNADVFKGVALSSLVMYIGEARIAAAALIIGLFLSLFIWLCTLRERKSWKIIGIIGILAMLIAGIVGIQQIASSGSRLHAFFVTQSGNRTIDWQEALQGIKQKPLLGWGPENFHVVYQQYLNPMVYDPDRHNEVWSLHPHNNTLEVLINGGVIGFIFYLLILTSLFGGLWKLYQKGVIDGRTYAILMGMLVAFIIQQQMIYDSIVTYVMFFSLLAVFAGLLDQSSPEATKGPVVFNGSYYAVVIGIVIIMFPIWLYAAYLPSQKMDEFQATTTLTSDVRAKAYQHLFHSPGSYAIDTDPEFFTDPLFYSYDNERTTLKSNPEYQQYASAEITALIAAVDPLLQHKFYDYHLTLSLLDLENLNFYLTGDKQDLVQAEVYAKHAFLLSPTDPQLYFAYAQTLVYEGNTSGAIVQLNKALALNQNYGPAAIFKKNLE